MMKRIGGEKLLTNKDRVKETNRKNYENQTNK